MASEASGMKIAIFHDNEGHPHALGQLRVEDYEQMEEQLGPLDEISGTVKELIFTISRGTHRASERYDLSDHPEFEDADGDEYDPAENNAMALDDVRELDPEPWAEARAARIRISPNAKVAEILGEALEEVSSTIGSPGNSDGDLVTSES